MISIAPLGGLIVNVMQKQGSLASRACFYHIRVSIFNLIHLNIMIIYIV